MLFDYLRGLDDLVVIADESHLYSVSAAAFHGALEELDPSACIGLTASVQPEDHVIYTYPLYRAIEEQYVKAPVLAFRKGGYGEDTASEEQQLSDAMQLRAIKQQAYDAYAEHSGAAHLNAVMFVVCADTEHATQVTELLRTPRYFGKSLAVLQVDSNHDDAQTQLLLEDLDAADSPVLAVVSVNKLKEGWDVKNIAVVVTLRAMASEVLTQQTMGRGLRLPFGKYTGVLQIDQLDIISHQSFRDLLEAENVLQQFGLEEATENPQATNQGIKDVVARSQGMNVGVTGSVSSGNAREGGAWAAVPQDLDAEVQSVTSVGAVQPASAAPVPDSPSQGMLFGGVGFMSIGEDGFAGQQALSYETVRRNQRFADVTYCFPRTTIKLVESPIDLSDVVEANIKAAAERVTSTGDILVRKQLKAALRGVLRAVDTESAEVDSLPVDDDSAEMALVRVVMDNQLVPATEANKRLARGYLVKKFMQYAPVDHWTVKALASADNELDGLVKGFVKGVLRNRTEKTALDPLAMPCKDALSLPLGDAVHERVESQTSFQRGRFYGGWLKSLYEAESFDSYTGEYLLAKLLDTSPNIVWWQRLHTEYGAFIYFNPKDRYYPDFVARESDGTLWIIEGKEQRGKGDTVVQAKRLAAEKVVHRLVGEDVFAGQTWGYLIAYEDDIRESDTWNDLKAKAHPVSNA